MADKEDAMVALLQIEVDGIEVNELGGKLECSPQEGQECLNRLLAAHKVELIQVDGALRVKMKKEEHAGLSNEERVLLTLVDEGSNKGIWIKNLRDNSGLSQIQIRKALKTLETKKLIKAVKGVGTTKKCYMPYDAVEDVSITGGTFYSDRQLDSELVQTLLSVCVAMLTNRRKQAVDRNPTDLLLQKQASFATAGEVATFIRDRKILHVPISDDDIERILEVAVLDGLIERRSDGAVRVIDQSIIRSSPLVSVPCALCPVAIDCAAGKEINPCDCKYLTDWLASK
ncbi:hypothetical protein PRIPAC_83802 [Pristionchus pacificus]|uniref:DNA-directed RNA polymerase III subunit RPC6 n=1 Tax=Pristionchus pacificus TaxID=54126 RepID=A0A2A6BKZ0_PRIPA|nr:hypothetical protein PRIPAC_83802 [Pristionchus pacificus]|eukprot:PDM66451.1 hypothetical protein PRIPAC_47868 [Pristionchus pacificus]